MKQDFMRKTRQGSGVAGRRANWPLQGLSHKWLHQCSLSCLYLVSAALGTWSYRRVLVAGNGGIFFERSHLERIDIIKVFIFLVLLLENIL